MPSLDVALAFALASLLLAVTPGPSVVLVVAQGAEGGRRAGVATALGLAVGTSAWVVVVAAGLGALFAARPGLVGATAAAGGAYLWWLAWTRWRSDRAAALGAADDAMTARPSVGPFLDGVVVNLLNASIAVFLAAFLPPFIDVDGPPTWQQVLALGAVLVAVSTVVNTAYGLAGGAIGRRARASARGTTSSRVVAVVYAMLGTIGIGSAILG